jgi:hypothetical protein
MGIWMSRLLSYFGDREARILVLGLDNAGKTTILCRCNLAVRSVTQQLVIAAWQTCAFLVLTVVL